VGFDDIPVARYLQPSLSTVRVSRTEWGKQAALRMIEFLEQEKPFSSERIPAEFIQRESSLHIRFRPTSLKT
jgi:LacI family transcriptional regulator